MKVQDFIQNNTDTGKKYISLFFLGKDGGAVFDSVANEGKFVKFYSFDELTNLSIREFLPTQDTSDLFNRNFFGESNKVVMEEETAKALLML